LLKAARTPRSRFTVAGETVVRWGLDWMLEWHNAQQRVQNGLRLISSSGMHKKGLSPAQLYKQAQNKALCYLNRPSAISGAGGALSSAPWNSRDGLVVEAL
jgi:hypothetical protein